MNYLQVTIGDRVLIYNLNEQNATLVNSMDDTRRMTDPQKFVEFGFMPSYSTQKVKGDDYVCKLASSPLGNIVI